MAMVKHWQLCSDIKLNSSSGKFILIQPTDYLVWRDTAITFALAVYWDGRADEAFKESFILLDDADLVMDQTPELECTLFLRPENMGAGFFQVLFPRPARYFIHIRENGVSIKAIPIDVV